MQNIPEIKIIRDNLEEETKTFSGFLYNPMTVPRRNNIFLAFPELKSQIENLNKEESQDIIRNFIAEFYFQHQNKINDILDENEKIIKDKSALALEELARLMDYGWGEKINYGAIPTILPFSPFKNSNFNFSILSKLRETKNTQNNFLFVLIHEISHFVFFDIMASICGENKIKPFPKNTAYLFKEALTVFLLNQKPLCDILELKNYKGNTEIPYLNVKRKDGTVLSLTDYISEKYRKKSDKISFKSFLFGITETLRQSEEDFLVKREFWNKYGEKILEDEKLLSEYKTPIELK